MLGTRGVAFRRPCAHPDRHPRARPAHHDHRPVHPTRHLTVAERSRRIELIERLLVYNLIGDAIYLPYDKHDTGYKGASSKQFGIFSGQNLLAFLSNGDARQQFIEQFPNHYQELCERALNQNDVETYHSEIATQARRCMSFDSSPVHQPISGLIWTIFRWRKH